MTETPTETPAVQSSATEVMPRPPADPQWYRVRSSFPVDQKRTLFRSVSERRARDFIARRFPRGEEVYLELPDGSTHSFVAERQGEHGQDTEMWQPFDPDSWRPPAEQEPPGQSAWADVES